MFKIHPITNLIDIILFAFILIFLKNSIVLLVIALLLLVLCKRKKSFRNYLILTLIVLCINIFCGKLIILGRLMTFIGYLCTIFVDYNKIDFIRVYDTLFSSTNYTRTSFFLKVLYYKEHFVNNFKIMIESTKKLGYHNNLPYYFFCLQNAKSLTDKSLQKMIYTFEKRFYFNEKRNKYKIIFSYVDVLMLIIHFILLGLVIFLGV